MVRDIVGLGPQCQLAKDRPAAFLYKILLRLAREQGVNISELMGGGE